ncbi:MAG: pentapeptide repeat-containing protein [Cyanobacteria bacterium P01_C01_bin.69]
MEDNTFANECLSDHCFDNQDLSDVNFRDSDLRGSSFRGSTLINANFDGADVRGCDFSMTDLTGTSFKNAKVGVYNQRFAELLFNAIGISALILGASTTAGDAIDSGIITNETAPSYTVSVGVFSSVISLCAAALFLLSIAKTLGSSGESQVIGSSILAISFSFAFVVSTYHTISLLKKLSSTTFTGSNKDTFNEVS